MSPVQTAKTALLLGMTLEQAREAFETPVEGQCFWLGGHCDNDAAPGDWLCLGHRAWRPTIATRDRADAQAFMAGSSPRLRDFAAWEAEVS